YVKSLSDGLDVIEFDLDTALVVDSVKFHRGLITHLHADNKIYLNLPGQLSKGEIDTVVVYYQGEPASSGFGSFTQATHGIEDIPVIWTLSEPYGALEWWP